MKVKRAMSRNFLAPGLVIAILGMLATPAMAIDLAAKAFQMTMPDGSTVPMWGFVVDDAGCYGQPIEARRTCVENLPDPTVPGPRIIVNRTSGVLTIRLTNMLPEPTSIVIPGQELPTTGSCSGPIWDDGSQGARTDPAQRVRSFVCEARQNGGRRAYRWRLPDGNQFQYGTYLYQSGTHPQVQVQMGLYGAARRLVDPGVAYPGVPYDMHRDVFYSEVDPALHEAVDAGTFSGSTLHYRPKHFLLQTYETHTTVADISIDPGNTACMGAGAGGVGPLELGTSMLLHIYNAGLRELAPTMLGSHFQVVAEGGRPMQFPATQYSILLQPGSTKDVMFTPTAAGVYPLIERRLNLTDPGLFGSVTGGMQTCIEVAAAPPAVAAKTR